MLIISHRGNIDGVDPKLQNNPDHISHLLKIGIDCEIDTWYVDGNFYLGHDQPLFKISKTFIKNLKLWIHCKNFSCLNILKDIHPNVFAHQNDDFALTSSRRVWTCIKNTQDSILVNLNYNKDLISSNIFGICTDYPLKYIQSIF
jgi:hypothetical protein